jgi:hypothetical protein
MLGCLLDHNDHKPAHDDLRLNIFAGNEKKSVHMNIAFPLGTLKGLIAESVELGIPAGCLLNLLPSSKNGLNCIQAFYITHVSNLKRT